MDDFTNQIYAAGGRWAETEVLGNKAIVKVNAPDALIPTLDSTFTRFPKDSLNDSLASLSTAQKNALKNFIQNLGYTAQEIQDDLGLDIGTETLRDVLVFIAKRRLAPVWNATNLDFDCIGTEFSCRSIDSVEQEVT